MGGEEDEVIWVDCLDCGMCLEVTWERGDPEVKEVEHDCGNWFRISLTEARKAARRTDEAERRGGW